MQFAHLRKYSRAPMRSHMLYEDEQYVFRARCLNISEGGVLLENFPHIPGKSIVHIMLDLMELKDLGQMSDDQIFNLTHKSFKRNIFRAQIKTVRRYGETSSVDAVFVQIGCQFIEIDPVDQNKISDYVDLYKRNLTFLIKELTHYEDDIDIKRILHVSDLMGYGAIKDIALLAKKVTMDAAAMGIT